MKTYCDLCRSFAQIIAQIYQECFTTIYNLPCFPYHQNMGCVYGGGNPTTQVTKVGGS